MRNSVSQCAGRVDVDFLTARNFRVEVESSVTASEEGVGLVGARQAGDGGAVSCGASADVEVCAIGVDGAVLDWRARVDREAAESVRRDRAGSKSKSRDDGEGLHIDGFVWQ